MKQEHAREIYVHLYSYAKYREQILSWEDSVIHNTRRMDEEYIRGGGYHSDPTARGAIRLAEPPKRVAYAQRWVNVIDEVYANLLMEDSVYRRNKTRGVAYVMEVYFCFHSEPRNKENNATMLRILSNRCHVSERTIYKWLHKIAYDTEKLARERGMFNNEQAQGGTEQGDRTPARRGR